ncbi:putative hydroxymethylpyrimidine transporter CytX [Litorilinea aerophila]|uniref:Putative hydroxymethylpyrimidine transporter CytX n=1 Tax=Litorilinea aerophila TaxID=1204385 RepID=A0A540VG05_9CHLR|nr:putative hydroxymethylpyrimidine transporter CytX [Litorilinea aerophila]MCC9076699.1 putative hydroxymethylpyrimidine transporter CytX [Litorilinea aerophila]
MESQQTVGRTFLPKLQAPPEWGIRPVTPDFRILRFLDFFVLWSSLGVGLLVLEAGALLVPGLSLGQALLAIGLGTLLGNLLLALTGVAGSDHAVPTMVLLRPVLGTRGSYLPSLLNLIQLIGWTAFEFWVMALAAERISLALWGVSGYGVWLVIFAAWCILLALGGPLVVVREWLEKFGVWLVYGVTLWMTYALFTQYDLGALWRQPGTGDMPFWLGVDLVVAMPISWLPLVCDFTRFARSSRGSFWGTFLGYGLANIWFYGLGALFILTLQVSEPTPEHLATAIMALTGGALALLVILVDETDNAFADIYSAAVTIQNVFPQVSQRLLVVIIGLVSLGLAAFLTMGRYFDFLLLIGSVFVPLFGILAADYFVVRGRRLQVDALYRQEGPYWYRGGVNWLGVGAWLVGVVVYHAIARGLPWLGASIPGFAVAFLLYLLLARLAGPHLGRE